jgi:hypothetical protein
MPVFFFASYSLSLSLLYINRHKSLLNVIKSRLLFTHLRSYRKCIVLLSLFPTSSYNCHQSKAFFVIAKRNIYIFLAIILMLPSLAQRLQLQININENFVCFCFSHICMLIFPKNNRID